MRYLKVTGYVALILLVVIGIGGILRVCSFPRMLPEGFEDSSKHQKKSKKKSKDTKKDTDKKSQKKKKKSKDVKIAGPPVDFDKNMKNFISDNSGNGKLMGSLQKDAKSLMKNQEQLMSMLQTTAPMLQSSMNMVKSFKGMFGDM